MWPDLPKWHPPTDLGNTVAIPENSQTNLKSRGILAWAIVEASPDALIMVDSDGAIEVVNRQAEAMFGYERSELVGRPVEVLLPDRHGAAHAVHRDRFSHKPEVRAMGTGMALAARRADGSEFPVEISLSPLSESGPLRVLAAVRDITDRLEAEARERTAAEMFRSAFSDGPVPMTLTEISPHKDRVIVSANQAMADLVGYTVAELIGMSFVDLTHPDDLEFDDLITAKHARGEDHRSLGRKRYLTASGGVVWVQVHVAILSRDGDRITTIGHSVDITAEVQAELGRAQHQRTLEALGEVRSALLSPETSIQEILELICRGARDLVNADTASFSQPDPHSSFLHDVAHDCVKTAYLNSEPRPIDDSIRAALSGRASLSSGLAGPAMAVPVQRSRGEVDGVLVLARKRGSELFDSADLALSANFASSAATALQLNEARYGLQRAELLEDRERIGRDMHDKVIGRLFATGMNLQSTTSRISEPSIQARLMDTVSEIDAAIQEIRTTIYGLRSQLDWGRGARGELLAMAAEHYTALGFEPRVSLTGPIDDLSRNIVDEVLATLREALMNSSKHARASRISVDVKVGGGELSMNISDDGVGLGNGEDTDLSTADQQMTGNGLPNIIKRAEALGGWAKIDSEPSRGVEITWTVPVVG